jgi:hypothetical protein
MSLTSWFKKASVKKKAAVITLATINGLTLTNSTMVGYRIGDKGTSGPYQSTSANILFAPATTAAQWLLSKHDETSKIGPTPVSFIANQTKKVFHPAIDSGVGVSLAILGAPGAWAGYALGLTASHISGGKRMQPVVH